jgi:hypothetical protein
MLNLARADLVLGEEPAGVAEQCVEVMRLASERGDPIQAADALLVLGLTAAKAGGADAAARVLASATRESERLGLVWEPDSLDDETMTALRANLGEVSFAHAWAEGSLLSPEDARALALAAIRSGAPAADTPATSS